MGKKKRPKSIPVAKDLHLANRRRKVAEYLAEGMQPTEIAKRLGISRQTVYRDKEWIEEQADRQWLKRTLDEHGVDEEALSLIPTDTEQYRELLKQTIVGAAELGKTTREIALELGIAEGSVSQYVNSYLVEVGDFAGRTADMWRQQEMIMALNQIAAFEQLQTDLLANKFEMADSRAIQQYNSAAKVKLEWANFFAKLMGLYQQKNEIEVTTNIVHEWAGPDVERTWPTEETTDGDWIDATG